MSSMYNISFDQIRQGSLHELFEILEEQFQTLSIDFYLIGAVARDIWLTALHGIPPGRVTRDLDLAILLADEEQYQLLRQRLLDTGRFSASRGNAYTLQFDDGRAVDLLPFGAIGMEGAVKVSGFGLTDIRIDGFEEVYETGTAIVTVDGKGYRVCKLEGIVVLKLIAYDDRPELRHKDILDISFILRHYFDIAETEIYERHNDSDVFKENGFDMVKAATRVMGRQMQAIINRSITLRKRIETIIDGQLALGEESVVAEWLIRDTRWSLSYALEVLEELRAGLRDTPTVDK